MYEHIYTDTYIYIYIYTIAFFSLTRRAQQSLRWHAFIEQHSTDSGEGSGNTNGSAIYSLD